MLWGFATDDGKRSKERSNMYSAEENRANRGGEIAVTQRGTRCSGSRDARTKLSRPRNDFRHKNPTRSRMIRERLREISRGEFYLNRFVCSPSCAPPRFKFQERSIVPRAVSTAASSYLESPPRVQSVRASLSLRRPLRVAKDR